MSSTLLAEVLAQSSEQTTVAQSELSLLVAALVGFLKGIIVSELHESSVNIVNLPHKLKEMLTVVLAIAPELAAGLLILLLRATGRMEAQLSADYIVLLLLSILVTELTLGTYFYKKANDTTKNTN